ncbi:hypothetical protein BS47DRAFT_1356401 [Hydnum rufescens UP504]|uniref:Uncharacterized protein n=1 Tax=Hydnum rufescens UP504 TaxID=1448309 RepID=A0A9P6ABV8_9AGAM|nr:hypothetical protein BS47DRAFT_1356401 [Hydnum rufescens UP504]
MTLKLTCSELYGKYAVHELLSSGTIPSCGCDINEPHPNEIPGRDILCDEDGKWLAIEREAHGMSIDAGPLVHRVPCIGYVFTEPPRAEPLSQEGHIEPITRNHAALISAGHRNPRALLGRLLSTRIPISLPDGTTLYPPPLSIAGRKIVVLGDTSDSDGIMELAADASLLVHEATNAYVRAPGEHATLENMSEDEKRRVREKAISRGHSTADMAGAFARKIRARRLILKSL